MTTQSPVICYFATPIRPAKGYVDHCKPEWPCWVIDCRIKADFGYYVHAVVFIPKTGPAHFHELADKYPEILEMKETVRANNRGEIEMTRS